MDFRVMGINDVFKYQVANGGIWIVTASIFHVNAVVFNQVNMVYKEPINA